MSRINPALQGLTDDRIGLLETFGVIQIRKELFLFRLHLCQSAGRYTEQSGEPVDILLLKKVDIAICHGNTPKLGKDCGALLNIEVFNDLLYHRRKTQVGTLLVCRLHNQCVTLLSRKAELFAQ